MYLLANSLKYNFCLVFFYRVETLVQFQLHQEKLLSICFYLLFSIMVPLKLLQLIFLAEFHQNFVLKIFLNLLNTFMIFKMLFYCLYSNPFVFNIIITCDISRFLTIQFCNCINVVVVKNFDQPSLICYKFTVKYYDALVIEMNFICKKMFHKILVSHNYCVIQIFVIGFLLVAIPYLVIRLTYFFMLFLLKDTHFFRCFL